MNSLNAARVSAPVRSPDKTQTHQLNLIKKLHQSSVAKRVAEIDWTVGAKAPMVVEFDPTTACNLACPDCISRDLLNQGFFSRDRIQDLTKEMVDAGVRGVILIGGGEPLAHPKIGWVIDYLGRNGVAIGLTTNGLLIDRYQEGIAQYVDWVRVSMDAATADTFQRIRPSISGKSMFGKVVENMRNLAPVKRGTLGYSFMIYSEGKFESEKDPVANRVGGFSNVSEIYQGAELARDIGCDYFEIKPMYDINHFSIVQERALMATAIEQSDQALGLADENFRVLCATKLHHILRGDGNIEHKDYRRCAVAELRTLVTPSGTYVCPYFRGRQDKNIGDLRKQSFSDMWHGEQRKEVMSKLDPSKDCRMHCIRHESNLILERMIRGESEADVIDDYDPFI